MSELPDRSSYEDTDDPMRRGFRGVHLSQAIEHMTTYITASQSGENVVAYLAWIKAHRSLVVYNRLTKQLDQLLHGSDVAELALQELFENPEVASPRIMPDRFCVFPAETRERLAESYDLEENG